ncbi:hypothetical protein A946_03910 [Methylacidiphilum kamchatkense Kam1]|uniref:Uncharacterized protein n=1 Tax=Methylacidiphilum kamchatkense Kam1 TaxID=1202785 RepID=A0ABR4ZY31_9BACT|nr:hypothetical protein [Methylacidiphilum kamchatkense]KIE59158.1 hypothetical protein A946_03910 [Methylacidiphilum kamchatkense Kam1]
MNPNPEDKYLDKNPSLFKSIEQKIAAVLNLYKSRPLPGVSKSSLLVDSIWFGLTDVQKKKKKVF